MRQGPPSPELRPDPPGGRAEDPFSSQPWCDVDQAQVDGEPARHHGCQGNAFTLGGAGTYRPNGPRQELRQRLGSTPREKHRP